MHPISTSDIGRRVRLTSEFADGKVLTVIGDRVVFASPHSETQRSREGGQLWLLEPLTEQAFRLKASDGRLVGTSTHNENMTVLYSPGQNDMSNTVWFLGRKGSIYQPRQNGKGDRYLWVTKDGLYNALDGFVGEEWLVMD